jgi:hypothetical protein
MEATSRVEELSAQHSAAASVDVASQLSEKSTGSTILPNQKSNAHALDNLNSRFLVPKTGGIVSIDVSEINKQKAASSSSFLRAGVITTSLKDPVAELEKSTDLVAELVTEKDANWKKKAAPPKKESAGKGWFNLPATELTDDIKNDFRLLRNRNALYRDRFYKKESGNMFPKYFQVGTVIEGATDVLSTGRINKKDRKSSILGEVLADTETTEYLRTKHLESQRARQKATKKRTFTGKFATSNKKKRY